jgi:uncharacterized protein (TIGR02147 family)
MNAFQFKDYRSYFNALSSSDTAPRGFRAALAREAGCQASYLSQVLKNRAHLTEDQLLGIAVHLRLSSAEIDHLLLLLRYEKAGTKKLKEHLARALQISQEAHKSLKTRVPAESFADEQNILGTYFSSWIPSAVHILTSSIEFQTPGAIAKRLGLPLRKVQETLEFLEGVSFVERSGSRWSFKRNSFHVPKESALQPAVQATRRELAARSMALNPVGAIHFSSLFTIDEADMKAIQDLLRDLVEKSHRLIQDSGTENLACLCLDLFEVV